jgi:signal transduction histidine kinase
VVPLDRLRIEQVISNLLSNAVKYGQGKPVDVALEVRDGAARLTVRDHGIGIDPRHQERIFERFERAVSTRHYGGFGLGLWIVRQIVDASGGSIRVESTEDEGSLFVVELPLH